MRITRRSAGSKPSGWRSRLRRLLGEQAGAREHHERERHLHDRRAIGAARTIGCGALRPTPDSASSGAVRDIAHAGAPRTAAPVTTASAHENSRTDADGVTSTGTNAAPGNASAMSARGRDRHQDARQAADAQPARRLRSATAGPDAAPRRPAPRGSPPARDRPARAAGSRGWRRRSAAPAADVTNSSVSDRENWPRISGTPPPAGVDDDVLCAESTAGRRPRRATAPTATAAGPSSGATRRSATSAPGFSRPIAYSQC